MPWDVFNLMQGINQNRHERLIAMIIELECALEAEITADTVNETLLPILNALDLTRAKRIEMQGVYVAYSKMLSDLSMQIAEYNNTFIHLRFYLRQQNRALNQRERLPRPKRIKIDTDES